MLSAIPSELDKSRVRSQESRVRSQESEDKNLLSWLRLLPLLALLPLLSYSTPAQAQINSSVLLAQTLPPLPNLQPIPMNQQGLPPVESAQQQYDYNSQTTNQTTPSSQYQYDYQNQYQYQNNQNYERYLVFVDNSNSQLLPTSAPN
jgi:hypothetical protein